MRIIRMFPGNIHIDVDAKARAVGRLRCPLLESMVGTHVTRSLVQGSLNGSKCSWIRKLGTHAASCKHTAVATGPPLWCGAI